MIDGFEILVMGFVVPALGKAWHLSPVQVGYVLSAGIFGMAVGATFLSPLADKFGRRKHVLLCMFLIVVGMAASAAAPNLTWLLIARAFAGAFIGAIIASLNVTVAEFSSDRRRGTAMGVYGMGFPIGSSLGGFVSILLIGAYGWRAPLWFSAGVTFILFFVALVMLPESINFLVEKRPANALKTYNKIGARLGITPASELPPQTHYEVKATVGQSMFQGVMLKRTLLLWFGYAFLCASFYFANTWTPKLLSDATGIPMLGLRVGTIISVGGIVGAIGFALLSLRIHPRAAAVSLLWCGMIAFLLFANFFRAGSAAFVMAFFVGMCANGGIVAFFAISPPIYPTAVRSSGVGWMMACGRFASFLAPIVTGYILAAGVTPKATYQGYGLVIALAGVCIFLLHRSYKGVHAFDAMQQESKAALQEAQA
jgi:benzoate transport